MIEGRRSSAVVATTLAAVLVGRCQSLVVVPRTQLRGGALHGLGCTARLLRKRDEVSDEVMFRPSAGGREPYAITSAFTMW